ncbi:hypothetical protein DXG01_002588 [Tephrocybe rancida]|nr:hypothetical protein DXG01_002588 [Tephrocybe rancida]
MSVPIILGSDKTTVSVVTGQNDFYPLYGSIGNVYNSVQCAHQNALSLHGFLSIPKTSKEYADDADYQKFCWQLFHTSLDCILSSLKPHMTKPRITQCAPPGDLDGPVGGCRTHEHTARLLEGCTLEQLWDDYGIVGDLITFMNS